jgi:hypothetical protein
MSLAASAKAAFRKSVQMSVASANSFADMTE